MARLILKKAAEKQLDNVKQLLSRRAKALNHKKNWESILQKTYRYSQPNRNIFDLVPMGVGVDQKQTAGQNINWYVFDLTLAHATDVYVNRMVNALTPAGKKWLNFVGGTSIPEQDQDAVKKVLQKNTDKFFEYIHQSNFQLVIHECFMDMVCSTGFMIVNRGFEKRNPIIFSSMPVDRTYADEGPYSTFDAYFRDWVKLPRDHAMVMWSGITLPEKNEDNNANRECNEFDLYECIYRNYKTMLWEHVVIEASKQEIVYHFTDQTSPVIGFRAKKLSGEMYGRGPAMDAMPAAATINQAMFDEIMSANFRALPIFMGFGDGVFNPNTFKLVPNTVIACSPVTAGTWPLTPVPASGDINWAVLVVSDLREQIQRIMLTNPFGAVEDPRKTATEIIERQREIVENSSATFSRVQRELFDPLVERVVELMKENGDWEEPEVDGKVIAVKYDTPLVISQGQKEVLDFVQFDQFIKQIYGPEASTAYYEMERVPPWIANKMNIDLNLVKNSEQILQMMAIADETRQKLIEQQGQNMGAAA